MKRSTLGLLSLALGTGMFVASGCSPDGVSPMAPAPAAPSAGLLSSTVGLLGSVVSQVLSIVPVVVRTKPLLVNETVKQTITPAGGTITLPNSKTTITFAPGAVDKPTPITATANAGLFVSYTFEPHGITFKAPVTLKTDLTYTTAFLHPEWASTMSGGYTPDGQSDIDASGNATVSELIPATTSLVQGKLTSASFNLPHFSGYILASGKTTTKSSSAK